MGKKMMSLRGRVQHYSKINMKQDQLSLTNNFRKGKAKQADLFRRLSSHLLLLFLLGNLQSWWVGEGGGFAVGAVLYLGHLKRTKKDNYFFLNRYLDVFVSVFFFIQQIF